MYNIITEEGVEKAVQIIEGQKYDKQTLEYRIEELKANKVATKAGHDAEIEQIDLAIKDAQDTLQLFKQ